MIDKGTGQGIGFSRLVGFGGVGVGVALYNNYCV